MQILIDGDACPVKQEIIEIARHYSCPVTLVTSFDHFSNKQHQSEVKTIYVDRGQDMADYKIVGLVNSGDIVVTQDYGLASLVLPKAHVLHHTGRRYTTETIDQLLLQRHIGQQERKAGKRTKEPKPFTAADREVFAQSLHQLLSELTTLS